MTKAISNHCRISIAEVWYGFNRDNPVLETIRDLGVGAGEITCSECGGDGDWTKYHPEPEKGPFQCVVCKGTGKWLVSI